MGSICIDQSEQKAQVITKEKCRVSGPLKLRVKENDSLMALHQKLNRSRALSISSLPPQPPGRGTAHCCVSASILVRLCPLPHYKCSLSITTQGYNNQILNYLFQRLFSAYLSCEIPRDVCTAIYLRGSRSPEHYGKNFITWGGRWQNKEHTSHPSEVRPSQGLARSSTLQWLGPRA